MGLGAENNVSLIPHALEGKRGVLQTVLKKGNANEKRGEKDLGKLCIWSWMPALFVWDFAFSLPMHALKHGRDRGMGLSGCFCSLHFI